MHCFKLLGTKLFKRIREFSITVATQQRFTSSDTIFALSSGPNSFTGEDCCELQVHGSIAVINSILSALALLSDYRLAKPGEFTRRAFHNGKLDLTEVEGLADLLQAETDAQRKQAFLQSEGSLGKLYDNWREILLKSVAHIEAHIDFEETESIESELVKINDEVTCLSGSILKHLQNGHKGEMLRNGVKTVILGEPNVGKSSLLNLLCDRPAAIVTPIAGTTRDILNITLNIEGYPMILTDTAGLRIYTEDIVEKEGINRARQQSECADLIILVIEYKMYNIWRTNNKNKNIIHYLITYLDGIGLGNLKSNETTHLDKLFNKNYILVFNKIDEADKIEQIVDDNIIYMSCKEKIGVEQLISTLGKQLKMLCGDPSDEHPSMNQVRHRIHLSNCHKHLQRFLNSINIQSNNKDEAILAEHLRNAMKHLGYLVGSVTNEQLLDVIFRDFCIGK